MGKFNLAECLVIAGDLREAIEYEDHDALVKAAEKAAELLYRIAGEEKKDDEDK
jgi:hypothetical protein